MSARGGTGSQRELPGLRRVSVDVVYPHVFEQSDREVGGVLVGIASRDGGLPLVTGAIEALQADEQRATLTFTQAAWTHVHRTLDEEYPADEQIVGWYHSHPGFGIFLSEHDLFIHRNFFSGPSQVALVVDPCARSEGVFSWQEGEVALLFERPTPDGWTASTPAHGPQPPGLPQAASAPPPRRYPRALVAVAATVGIAAGFGAGHALLNGGEQSARARPAAQTTPAARTTIEPPPAVR